MKKLTLTILVAMVPFLIMAQKNKRKSKNTPAVQEMKVIKGVQMIFDDGSLSGGEMTSKHNFDYLLKQIQYAPVEVLVGPGGENQQMHDVLEAASTEGWEVYNANTVVVGNSLVYFYFMRR